MSADWKPMETAPRDGTAIQAKIPGNGSVNIIMWMGGFLDEAEQDCCCWVFVHEEQEPPECWTDGVCWSSNENDDPSVQPVAWKMIDR